MSHRGTNARGRSRPQQWMNLFRVTNLEQMHQVYRLLRVEGIPKIDQYHKQLNLLAKQVAYSMHRPVSIVNRAGESYLSIPEDAPDPNLEWHLTPHVASLVPQSEVHEIRFAELDEESRGIALNHLRFALQGALMRNENLWGRGRLWYEKSPSRRGDRNSAADIYPGFEWRVVLLNDSTICLAADATFRYVDRAWATELLSDLGSDELRFRHFLYHFGPKWYTVQLMGLTGQTISEETFHLENQGVTTDVYSYTMKQWGDKGIGWIEELDPASPAILYRYPGSELKRYGALALCKRILSTSEDRVRKLHRYSILSPKDRLNRITTIVRDYFHDARLAGTPIKIQPSPLEVEPKVFQVPAQRFGNDHVLAVGTRERADNRHLVKIEQLGRERMRLLMSRDVGPLDRTPFDAQYLMLPLGAPRAINEDFERRFISEMQAVSGRKDYRPRRILYEDRGATTLRQQVAAIEGALGENGVNRGYVLLVLPDGAHPDLHDFIKKELWPNLQFQCATIAKIRRHYGKGSDGQYRVTSKKKGRLISFARNCSLSMLVVNRKWSWALETPLHHDIHIGIDVLNGVAGITAIAENGRKIVFKDYPSQQKERLPANQIRTILVETLADLLGELDESPASILVHRDGMTYESELRGMRSAIRRLKDNRVLPADVEFGVIIIQKSMAENLRLFEGSDFENVQNPLIGSYQILDDCEGIVCTTGAPFRFPGTSNPLRVRIQEGNLNIRRVLEDVFALSHLAFTAPDKCVRLPATIKIADDFLAPIASSVDEDEARYGEDLQEESGERASTVAEAIS